MNKLSVKTRGMILSVVILLMALCIWHVVTAPKVVSTPVTPTGSSEYQQLMGKEFDPSQPAAYLKSFPTTKA